MDNHTFVTYWSEGYPVLAKKECLNKRYGKSWRVAGDKLIYS